MGRPKKNREQESANEAQEMSASNTVATEKNVDTDAVQRRGITIKKAKIKDNLFLEVEYTEQQKDGTNTVKKDCTAPVHDDLKLSFKMLNIHLAYITQQVGYGEGLMNVRDAFEEPVCYSLDPEKIFRMTKEEWDIVHNTYCKGFSIGGNGDHEGVTLIGYREFTDGKILNLTSPFYKWDDNEPYIHTHELSEVIEMCKHEVFLYLFEGKHQPEAQLELFATVEDEEEDDMLLQ